MKLTRHEAEDFLYFEARLIDEGRLQDWNAMFTDDGIYWLPIDESSEPGKQVSLIYDDAMRRQERIFRLLQTPAHAQDPPSSTQHFVTNVSVHAGDSQSVTVYSNQIIYEIRGGSADYRHFGLGQQQTFAARCEHTLKYIGDRWKISMKKMMLLNRAVAIGNLTFIL